MKQHTDNNNEPHLTQGKVQGINNYLPSLYKKKDRFSWSLLWISLGMLVLFLSILVLILYWNPAPMTDDDERALLRVKNLTELNKSNKELLTTYGWVDQTQGVLHLPIERAMELEMKDLNNPSRRPHAAYPIAPIDLIPKPAGMPTTQ
jgi:hypothetical protein